MIRVQLTTLEGKNALKIKPALRVLFGCLRRRFCWFWHAGAVAGFACGRRRLIEQHKIAIDRLPERVTGRADYILVCSFEREECLVMIEERRPPLGWIMTTRALLRPSAKLVGVRILVAISAADRSAGKVSVSKSDPRVGRAVALRARNGAVRTDQWKLSLAVIELCKIMPVLCRVAGRAAERFAQ